MRLRKSKNQSEEEITKFMISGYRLLNWLKTDYEEKKSKGSINHAIYSNAVNKWGDEVINSLKDIFPTNLEANQFLHPKSSLSVVQADTDDDYKAKSLRIRLTDILRGLDEIKDSLSKYTDMPLQKRLYIEDIDSFQKVRDINPALVLDKLGKNGYFDKSEDIVQSAIEKILAEPFHKKDWGGEYNDLYTSNLQINGARRAAAFLLKGNGLKKEVLEIGDCGKNGDQIVRLFETPADIYIIQFVGNISEAVIKDVDGKTDQRIAKGNSTNYCIINGQDTARLLKAYQII
jgi:hypothetical protein